MMKRRALIFGAGAIVLVTTARAQSPRRYRLGIFGYGKGMWGGALDRILAELGRLGYARGARLEVHERFPQKRTDLDELPRQLVAIPVDVILTEGTELTRAVQRATKVVPIVTTVGDPISVGFARKLQKPGGNITGLAQNRYGTLTKQFELLRLLRPGITEMANIGANPVPQLAEAAADAGIRLHAWQPFKEEREKGIELEKSIEQLKARRIDTVFSAFGGASAARISPIAIRHRIAFIVGDIELVKTGALMSVEPADPDPLRVAWIIDRIFRGDKPADIPFDLAERSVSAINAKTAAALGIVLTPEVVLRVDHVFR
jgi:putative tryptophan/tyrosine transport system substrate-binding protein